MPCPPTGRDPYRLEFLFVPDSRYQASGNTRIDVFAINGDLPYIGPFSDGSISEIPMWGSTGRQTGGLIGSFTLPTGGAAKKQKLIFINTVVCMSTINLRFSISGDAAGSVNYFSSTAAGLRIRYGC